MIVFMSVGCFEFLVPCLISVNYNLHLYFFGGKKNQKKNIDAEKGYLLPISSSVRHFSTNHVLRPGNPILLHWLRSFF